MLKRSLYLALAASALALTLLLPGIAGNSVPAANATPVGIQVTVCVKDSLGVNVVPGTTYYKIGSSFFFANTLDANSCKIQAFPVGTTNVEIWTTINDTLSPHLTQDVSTNPVFNFQTNLLTLRLETCSGTGLAGGIGRYGIGADFDDWFFPANPTGANGEAAAEFFPGTYSFDMVYKFTSQQKLSTVVPDDDTKLVWQTTNVTINYPGEVSYGGPTGDYDWFKQSAAPGSMELLPGTYWFHFRGYGAVPDFRQELTFSGCSFGYGDKFTVYKDWTDLSGPDVSVSLSCSDGSVTPSSALINEGAPGVFSVSGYDTAVTCTATETVPVEGVTTTGTCTSTIGYGPGSTAACTITNTVSIPSACTGMTFDRAIFGTADNDTLTGTGLREVIFGAGGNDTINGGAGNDCLVGGEGSDTIRGGSGNDKLLGGNGTDSLTGDSGTDTANGGGAADTCDAESETSC